MAVLLLALIALGTLLGAAAYATTPVHIAAAVFIGGWLLIFGIRERAARSKRHQGSTAPREAH
ncbi:hypothetical protein [Wenjunlia tyrosinilytica]|uniref:Small hydrophobic membrane protein n=1 Tax=Wenjunlia tyrosinilytica TaxID=1544741 RepID=A0A917ZM97_9ACTN|nr:hypothetical protein [Wenjunlia tyrosinilytica]GGO85380.1 hypothetical protein GCM10012280_19020 [Wenjunlia tyrosinilytica]